MADNHEYHRGEMNISEQAATYHWFMGLSKWGSMFLAALLALLVFWFCTPLGFFPGAIAFVVVLAAGWFLLRDKPEAH